VQEQGSAATAAATPPAVVGQGPAHIDGQRQPVVPVPLARHGQFTAAPVHVIDAEHGHLPRPQPQAGEHGQDREVAPTRRAAPVTTGDQPRHLDPLERPRRPAVAPTGTGEHRIGQRRRGVSRHVQEPQQRPQPGRHVVERPGAATATLGEGERGDLRRGQAAQVTAVHARLLPVGRQEQSRHVAIPADRASGQTSLGGEKAGELLHQWIIWHRCHRLGYRTQLAQVAQQWDQASRRQPPHLPARAPIAEEQVHLGSAQVGRTQPRGCQPPAHVGHEVQVCFGRRRGVALSRQLPPVARRVRLQRARDQHRRRLLHDRSPRSEPMLRLRKP